MKQVKALLEKQMSRKEFLQFIGVAIITLLGVSNFISLLASRSRPSSQTASKDTSHGFGSRKFGA